MTPQAPRPFLRLIWEFPLSLFKDLQVAALSLSVFFFVVVGFCWFVLVPCSSLGQVFILSRR